MSAKTPPSPEQPALARFSILRLLTDHRLEGGAVYLSPGYEEIAGYRSLNVYLRFAQASAAEPPVDLGVLFAFDREGTLAARHFARVASAEPGPQKTSFSEVSGAGSWEGASAGHACFLAHLPVMGPFVGISLRNLAPLPRTVTVWAYLTT